MAKWEMEKRQEWIANRQEPFRRKDLMEAFDVSIASVSSDIKTYQKNGGVLVYDLSKKQYSKPKRK